MSAITERLEAFLRPPVEIRGAIGWAVATVWTLVLALFLDAVTASLLTLAGMSAVMSLVRGVAALRVMNAKMALAGKPFTLLPSSNIRAAMPALSKDQSVWLGWGWKWGPVHTQRAYEVMKREDHEIYPPRWLLKARKMKHDPYTAKGLSWIHGLETKEQDIMVPIEALRGHTAVIATTGSIKTTLMKLLVYQFALMGDTVIVVDPKGDPDLAKICKEAADLSGDPSRYLFFHPSFSSKSVRLDLLKNWDSIAQIPSRIQMVLAAEEDNFVQFCWMAIHQISSGMKYVGIRPSIYSLKNAMESPVSVELLTKQAMDKFFNEVRPDLQRSVAEHLNQALSEGPRGGRGRNQDISIPELAAQIQVFTLLVPTEQQPEDIRGLVSVLSANREWFGKMIVSIRPMLTKLTTDDLRGLLSPDYDDINDDRSIMDMNRVISGGHILYLGINSMSDPAVGSALAAMALADASAVAAEIYNYESGNPNRKPRRVHIMVDEWGDAVCEPLIQQANKGRGAGFMIWAFGQTFNDLIDKFGGNVAKAKRFIGNMNNLIVGAVQDPDTMKMIVEKLGEVPITIRSQSQGIGSKTEDHGLEFSGNQSESVSERNTEVFPKSLLPKLPDLHYVGLINRGTLIKGRIPVITLSEPTQ
jgi:conjugal transfer pilus assembly protein TraD